jgi:hypothetical protein
MKEEKEKKNTTLPIVINSRITLLSHTHFFTTITYHY